MHNKTLSLLCVLAFSSKLNAQAQQDRAFQQLDKEISLANCPAKLQSQAAMMVKATEALQRLDRKVTELKSQLSDKQQQIEQLDADKLPISKKELAELQAQVAMLQEYKSKNTKLAVSTVATLGAYEENKKTLANIQEQNQQLLLENQSLKQEVENWKQKIDTANVALIAATTSNTNAVDCPLPEAKFEATSSSACQVLDNSNLQRLKIGGASATTMYDGFHNANNLIDGDPSRHWGAHNKSFSGQSVRLDLDKKSRVSKIHMLMPELEHSVLVNQINALFSNGSVQTISLDEGYG